MDAHIPRPSYFFVCARLGYDSSKTITTERGEQSLQNKIAAVADRIRDDRAPHTVCTSMEIFVGKRGIVGLRAAGTTYSRFSRLRGNQHLGTPSGNGHPLHPDHLPHLTTVKNHKPQSLAFLISPVRINTPDTTNQRYKETHSPESRPSVLHVVNKLFDPRHRTNPISVKCALYIDLNLSYSTDSALGDAYDPPRAMCRASLNLGVFRLKAAFGRSCKTVF
jgi:hypothetical protein